MKSDAVTAVALDGKNFELYEGDCEGAWEVDLKNQCSSPFENFVKIWANEYTYKIYNIELVNLKFG